jgi:hypothetical protein
MCASAVRADLLEMRGAPTNTLSGMTNIELQIASA